MSICKAFARLEWALGTLLCVAAVQSISCGGASHSESPVIRDFHATPARVSIGEEAVLSASYAHGTGTVDHEVGNLANGESVKVSPRSTTTYILRVADGNGGSTTTAAQVVVAPSLRVRLRGCEGAVGNVKVEGPGEFVRDLTASATLPELHAGEYTITALAASDGSKFIQPLDTVQKVQVTTGTEVTVRYLSPVITVNLDGGVPLEMVLIPAGTFTMGSNEGDPGHYPAHRPPHKVTIGNPFYMAKYPTTQAQWEAILGDNPSMLKDPGFPVTFVSYDQIQGEFLTRINSKPLGLNFRLPTEAEWEYACRAGTTSDHFFGTEGQLEDYAWFYVRGDNYLHRVGLKKPNPWGLYDLSGQVFQWCQDLAHDGYEGAPDDGAARQDPDRIIPGRIARGHSIHELKNEKSTSYDRWQFYSAVANEYMGFRLVADVGFRSIN